jgi:hypothetical protein
MRLPPESSDADVAQSLYSSSEPRESNAVESLLSPVARGRDK